MNSKVIFIVLFVFLLPLIVHGHAEDLHTEEKTLLQKVNPFYHLLHGDKFFGIGLLMLYIAIVYFGYLIVEPRIKKNKVKK